MEQGRMQQVRFAGAGGPEVIRLEDAPVPRPGPGQVLVRVEAAGVNRPDCIQRAGGYPPPPGATDVPGLEIAGRVVALGDGVVSHKEGDLVCALVISGGYAEFCVAEASLCLPVPEGASLLEAGALPETVFTVYDNVVTRGGLAPGESFLVHGGSSGIGSVAIQLAKARGALVFATAGSEDKCAFCRDLGADRAINYRAEDFVAVVKDATGKRGVDVVLDMVGGDYVSRNLSALAIGGRLVQIAFLGGSRVAIDLMPVMRKRLTVTGSTLRPRSNAEKAAIAQAVRREVWPLLASGRIKPVVHATFPLAEAEAAHRLMESSRHLGKIVLVPEHASTS